MLQCQFLMCSIFQFQCDTPCTNSSMTMAKKYLQGDSSFNSSKKKKIENKIQLIEFENKISNISLLLAHINNSHNNRYPDESSSRDGPEFGSLSGKRTRKWVILSKHLHFWDKRGGVQFPNAVIFHLISRIFAVSCIFKFFCCILTFI